jgi:hypothetical protein
MLRDRFCNTFAKVQLFSRENKPYSLGIIDYYGIEQINPFLTNTHSLFITLFKKLGLSNCRIRQSKIRPRPDFVVPVQHSG